MEYLKTAYDVTRQLGKTYLEDGGFHLGGVFCEKEEEDVGKSVD